MCVELLTFRPTMRRLRSFGTARTLLLLLHDTSVETCDGSGLRASLSELSPSSSAGLTSPVYGLPRLLGRCLAGPHCLLIASQPEAFV